MATKQVLIQLGEFGGDGYGVNNPELLLYTDGQLLTSYQFGYGENTLSTAQMCALLHEIANTGFFQVAGSGAQKEEDPIYNFDASAQFSDGGPNRIVQINGNPAKSVTIYVEYEPYVVSPIRAVLRLLSYPYPYQNTGSTTALKPYVPNRLVLSVEAGRGIENSLVYSGDPGTPPVRIWPADLPPLADLLGDGIQNNVYIVGALVEPLRNLPYGVYVDRGKDYSVIVTPLLPHETVDHYSEYPGDAQAFALPFRCGD